ncbi:MAG: ArnT family glycosyltransferase [Candidatus Promineifilaceae bacterium]
MLTRYSPGIEKSSRVLLLLIILLATGLRLPGFFGNHFHADEALFASWARLIAIWCDPLLLTQAVDKPPLLFYLQALAFPMFGPVEWAARTPNMIASILLVPLTAVFTWRLFHDNLSTLLAALLVATSPMAIQFSPTAFIDPLLTAFLIAALLFIAGRSRPRWCGLFFGLAVLTKYQAWLFLPLLGGLGWLAGWERRQWKSMIAGFLAPFLLLLAWQFIRSGSLDLWSAQINNYGGLRPAWSWELLPRLAGWAAFWPVMLGSGLMIVLFLASILVVWFSAQKSPGTPAYGERLIILFILGFSALHWLVAVSVWDRYLLPLVPLSAVITGRGISLLSKGLLLRGNRTSPKPLISIVLILALFAILQLPGSIAAREGLFPVGGQRNADRGAWEVAEYLDQAPYGTVLYDHWFSWHWRYAFIDKGVYTSWFPHPTGLVDDLQVFGSSPGDRYLVVPDDESAAPVLRRVEEINFTPRLVLHTDTRPGMILYLLEPS